jgi:hypothetical protein
LHIAEDCVLVRRDLQGEPVILPPERMVFLCGSLPFGFEAAFCAEHPAGSPLKGPDVPLATGSATSRMKP